MTSASEISRLRWRCRRGMKELDVVLSHYLEASYPMANEADQVCFRKLLEMQDPELHRLILGKDEIDDKEIERFLRILRRGIRG